MFLLCWVCAGGVGGRSDLRDKNGSMEGERIQSEAQETSPRHHLLSYSNGCQYTIQCLLAADQHHF